MRACRAASDGGDPVDTASKPRGADGFAQSTRTGRPAVAAARAAPLATAPSSRGATPATVLTPNVLGVGHWDRLLGGALYAATSRIDWATLLRRTFDVDVLVCPACGGRLRVLGEVTDRAMVRLVLESLELPADAPRAARARDPTELLGEDAGDEEE